MTSPTLVERIVEAWENTPDWANETKAKAAIDIVLEEAAKKIERNDEPTKASLGGAFVYVSDAAATLRALKGKQ